MTLLSPAEARDQPLSHVKRCGSIVQRGRSPLAAERPGSSGEPEVGPAGSEADSEARCEESRSAATATCP